MSWLWLWLSLALARSVPWYTGRMIGSVSLSTPQGGGPDGELFPLLDVEVGQDLTPAMLRNDVITLMQVGVFSTVEVDVRPSPMHPNYVDVVYRIFPAPVLRKVEFDIKNRSLRQGLLSDLQLQVGKVFFNDIEIDRLKREIEAYCEQSGWSYSDIELQSHVDNSNNLTLKIKISDLKPKIISKISFVGIPMKIERNVRRVLRHHNVVEENRLVQRKLEFAREDIRSALFDNGYVQARVQIGIIEDSDGSFFLSIIVEPGLRLELETSGMRLSRKQLFEILNIYPGDRVTKNDIPKFKERLQFHLKSLGYSDAKVEIVIEDGNVVSLLRINIDKRERWFLNTVTVSKNKYIDAASLKRLMAPKKNILQQYLYDDQAIHQAIIELEDYFDGLGYVGTKVTLDTPIVERTTTWTRTRKEVRLHVDIDESEPRRLGDIEVYGVPESIQDFPAKPETDIYSPMRLQVYEAQIQDFLQDKGFWHAEVERSAQKGDDGRYRVIYRVNAGSKSRLRSIIIQGQGRTDQNIIRERVPIDIGEPILPSDISTIRQQLYDLDIFQSVRVEMIGNQEDIQDLRITVEEKPNWILETGGRVSTDQGVQATMLVGPRNMNGRASKLSLLGQAGYGWEDEGWRLNVDQLVWRTSIRYTAPALLNVNHDVFSDIILREILQESYYRFRQSGASIGIESRLNQKTETVLEYRVRYMAVEDIDAGSLVEQDPWNESFQSDRRTIDGYPIRWWTGVQMTLFWDNRNSPLNPTQGQWIRSQVSIGDGMLNSQPAVRGVFDVNSLWDFNSVRYLLRLYGGIGWSPVTETLGFDERFSLGGANSLRGFARNRVGPMNQSLRSKIDYPNTIEPSIDQLSIRKEPTLWVPTGGDYMTMVSQEVHFPLGRFGYDASSWILFLDVGRVEFLSNQVSTDSMTMNIEPFLRYSVGTGIRYSTAIGPLALDLALNPNPIAFRDEQYIHFHGSLGSF